MKETPLKSLGHARMGMAIIAALTGAGMAFGIVYYHLDNYLPYWLVVSLSSLAAIMCLYVVDFGGYKDTNYTLDYLLQGRASIGEGKRKVLRVIFILMLSILMIGRYGVSAYLSWEGGYDVAQAATTPPELKDPEKIHSNHFSKHEGDLAAIDAAIAAANKDKERAFAALDKQNLPLKKVVDSGKDKGWHAAKIAERESKLHAKYDKRIDKLMNDRARAVEASSTTSTALLSTISAHNEKITKVHEKRVNRLEGTWKWAGMLCLIGSLLIAFLQSLQRTGHVNSYVEDKSDEIDEAPSPIQQTSLPQNSQPQASRPLFSLPPQNENNTPPPTEEIAPPISNPPIFEVSGFQIPRNEIVTSTELSEAVQELKAEIRESSNVATKNAPVIQSESFEISNTQIETPAPSEMPELKTPVEQSVLNMSEVLTEVRNAAREGVCEAQAASDEAKKIIEGVKILHEDENVSFWYERNGKALKVEGCTKMITLSVAKQKVKEYEWKLKNAKTERGVKSRSENLAKFNVALSLLKEIESENY